MVLEALSADRLYRACDVSRLPFETTASLDPLDERFGQARATEAIDFAISIRRDGYNLYAMGPAEAGKSTTVKRALERHAAAGKTPDDLAYVRDFSAPHRARLLVLPAGRAKELARDIDALIDELRQTVPAALEGDELSARKQAIEDELKAKQEATFEELQSRAIEKKLALLHTPMGFALAPVKEGRVVTPSELAELPQAERERITKDIETLGAELQARLAEMPRWGQEARKKVKELVRETLRHAVSHLIEDLRARYSEFPKVVDHLEKLGQDVLDEVQVFLKPDREGAATDPSELDDVIFRRYRVNVVVDHSATKGAPVVFEIDPSYDNLFGRIEHKSHQGALFTDFNLIKAGALHRASGGYLVLDARNLLMQPLAWEALKRALRTKLVKVDGLGRALGLVSTITLEPEPMPLDVKVVLLGDRRLGYLLEAYDPEYHALFKVTADFEDSIPRAGDADLRYARLLGTLAREEQILPLDRSGVGRVIEQSARIVEDAGKLSAHVGSVRELLTEADHFARARSGAAITAEDVERAIHAAERRDGRIRELVIDQIDRGTVLIETTGARVGQINGLSVSMIGRTTFGRPSRISVRVRLGRGEVVDIEREVELGGPLHSKGVMILAGYLGGRHGRDRPLALGATITFEQSYGMVDGDSASSAELYALLSAISEIPIEQGIAVTGSVNQLGEVQPIGGVNEKIEGFFEVARRRGLDGTQGVLIPKTNVQHLMLSKDVRDAVEHGRFHVWAVSTIDEGLELLTGLPADVVHHKVEARLDALAKLRASLEAPKGDAATNGATGPAKVPVPAPSPGGDR